MGRRALPKIDETVDTTSHLFRLDDVPCPFDQETFFGRNAPLEVEIGSGKGLFLLNASGVNPDRDYVGIETARKYASFAANRLALHERTNAKVISGDGLKFFAEFLPDERVDAVHVYFPDPWWKQAHRARRVIQPAVVKDIERMLKPSGELHFWTDVEEYFVSAHRVIAENSNFEGPIEVPEQAPINDMDYRTHFERRMRMHGHPIYRSRFVKSS